jgi:hypothetical protein
MMKNVRLDFADKFIRGASLTTTEGTFSELLHFILHGRAPFIWLCPLLRFSYDYVNTQLASLLR